MTFIPGDNKVQIPNYGVDEAPHYEDPAIDHEPPPYALSDTSAAGQIPISREEQPSAGFLSADEEKVRLRAQDHANAQRAGFQQGNGESSTPKIPKSSAIKSSTSVALVGPLEILGPVSSLGSVTLSEVLLSRARSCSSATVKLSHNVNVGEKIYASESIKLSDYVFVNGKLEAEV